jgi:hypothetical protein
MSVQYSVAHMKLSRIWRQFYGFIFISRKCLCPPYLRPDPGPAKQGILLAVPPAVFLSHGTANNIPLLIVTNPSGG